MLADMPRMTHLALALCLLVAAAAHAEPQDPTAAEAERHWTAGMAHFQLEEWDEAIKEWEAGFRLKPVPQFLYNIAQAYRQSKRYDKALSFYRKYLRMSPDAANRPEVEGHIRTLEALVAQQQKATSSPPVQPMPATPSEKAAPAPATPPSTPPPAPPAKTEGTSSPAASSSSSSAAPSTATSTPAAAELTAQAPPRQSVVHKGWFWGVVAGSVVVVAAAVTLGVVFGTADSAKTLPMVRF